MVDGGHRTARRVSARRPSGPNPRATKSKTVLALPKGLVDPGEKPLQTALREVYEETGVTAELIAKLGDIKYVYTRSWGDGGRVFKIVSFYLMRYRSGRINEISPAMRIEVARALWVPLQDAATLLAYKGEKQMVRRAMEYVQSHAEFEAEDSQFSPGLFVPHNERMPHRSRSSIAGEHLGFPLRLTSSILFLLLFMPLVAVALGSKKPACFHTRSRICCGARRRRSLFASVAVRRHRKRYGAADKPLQRKSNDRRAGEFFSTALVSPRMKSGAAN